jgi:MtfA peptidase
MKPEMFHSIWDPFLYKYHLYYRDLSIEGKKRFLNRVNSIFHNVTIMGKNGLEMTDEIRILVVSNLVQLTFGLKEYWLYGYEYIYLYPEAFEIKNSSEAVTGSTYNSKIIALSWQDFAKDHLSPKDGKNVSFAQFALALVRTVLNGRKFDLNFGSYLDTWFEIIKKECAFKSRSESSYNLDEGMEDLNDIFTKCVEMFFEKPAIFKKELPTSYAHLCVLLNQDPLNITEDYKVDKEKLAKSNVLVEIPKFIPIHYKYKEWHWLYNFSFFGITACPMIIYFIIHKYMFNPISIVLIMVLTGLFLSAVLYKKLKKLGLFKQPWLIVLNGIFGYGPCLITGILFLNQIYGYGFTAKQTKHEIIGYSKIDQYSNQISTFEVTFNYKDGFLEDAPSARKFVSFETIPTNPKHFFNGVIYEIRNGLIGIPIIANRELY